MTQPPGDALVKRSFADEFFSEREVRIPAENAASFYAVLAEGLDGAPHFNHTTTGNIVEFKSGQRRFLRQPDVTFFFRGQADASFGLNSSLYRMITPSIKEGMAHRDIERLLNEAENRVLATAQKHGIVRGLTALERLTVLQHHGAPTRLIDVSSDWRVALYFATETADTKDGRLFAVTTSDKQWRTFPRAEGDGLAWQQGAIKTWESAVIPVLLPFSDARMVAQCGFFLVGGTTTKAHGNRWHSLTNGTLELTEKQMHNISTLSIRFPFLRFRKDLAFCIKQIEKSERRRLASEGRHKASHSSYGFTIRIPSHFKPALRACLAADGLTPDTIYPPLDEVRRLLQHVARTP